ncbi:endonuclease III [Pantoea sp. Aalb]|uniref:endonuclease III n=1 Tax=Pantoea sp. Aalb TaxID=2576762 RepID=UPI00132C8009|nr:endonuclease III [Pantoea sp. Aalb]MXP67415.1 endonuclease III [Pantoea sp. Aalb]
MNKSKRQQILIRLRDNHPMNDELHFSSSFELLIAVLLSSQSTDLNVKKATDKLYSIANTPNTILELGLDTLKEYIKTIGLFNKKASNIINICHILLNEYGGQVPENRNALENLPGVGRKTANVVLNVAFGWPTIAVDTHVFRVSNRTGFATGKNVITVEKKLLKVVPSEFKINCHRWLISHGQNTCKARNPRCYYCSIKDICEFKSKIKILCH